MAHILLLEDDPLLGKSLSKALELEGYSVDWARDIKNAEQNYKNKIPDLFLLDWNLPDGTGYDWANKILIDDPEAPIIFLTARLDDESVIKALRGGAKDYIRKPFSTEELFLRMKKTLKEVISEKDTLSFGDLTIEKNEMQAFYRKQKIQLSALQYRIIELFVMNAQNVLSRDDIIEHLSAEGEMNDRTIDSHISHLRKKLSETGADSIKISSVYGAGYKLEKAEK